MIIHITTFFTIIKLIVVDGQNPSPCPEIFSYETRESSNDRWYGVIKFSANKNFTGIWLNIVLDRPADLLGVCLQNTNTLVFERSLRAGSPNLSHKMLIWSWFSSVSTCDNTVFVIRKSGHRLQLGQQFSLRFFVKFNLAKAIPSLKMVKLNEEVICNEQIQISELVEHIPIAKYSKADNTRFGRTDSDISLDESCGIVASRPTPLILHGQDTSPGQWPWHAVLYHHKTFQILYACGATLITKQHVVTAAHCVTDIGTRTVMDPNDISVSLGKYNLKTFEEDFQNFGVVNIFVNPKYNPSRSFNDIAVLKLSGIVEITKFVRPCCLWDEDSGLAGLVGKEGTVVGWDLGNDKSHRLMQAKMPVVSTRDCIFSKEEYREFLSENNYCAGYRNGTSVCKGDSGGAMVFPRAGPNGKTVWYIRGIVSLSLVPEVLDMCEVSNYNIFTDVAKFISWINNVTHT